MAQAKRVTDAEKKRIAKLHGEGRSLTEIAKTIGRSKDTISRIAKAKGLSFDTSQTAAATTATKDRSAALRAQLETALLDDALDVRAMLHRSLGKDDARDVKDAAAAMSYLLNGSLKITDRDAIKDESTSDVAAWLIAVKGQ